MWGCAFSVVSPIGTWDERGLATASREHAANPPTDPLLGCLSWTHCRSYRLNTQERVRGGFEGVKAIMAQVTADWAKSAPSVPSHGSPLSEERRAVMKQKQENLIPAVVPMALSSEEAARALGVSPKTLANWRCAGRGPAYVHIGDSPHSPVLYLIEDLRSWLRSRRRCGGGE